jgi:hypothetical protein
MSLIMVKPPFHSHFLSSTPPPTPPSTPPPPTSLNKHFTSFIPQSFKLKMGGEKDWTNKITEVFRIDRRLISQLPVHIFSEIKEWESKINLNYTYHAIKRMKEYIGRVSDRPWDDGKHYIEFYHQEGKYLENPINLQQHFCKSKIVEIGLNRFGKVCKVSYVLPLHEVVPLLYEKNSQSRCLFFCVCIDGYIKTINITPNEKKRRHYGGSIEYLNKDTFLSIVHGCSHSK